MWRKHEIASVYRNLLFEVKSFLQKTLTEELLEPKINAGTFHVYHVASSTPCQPRVLLVQWRKSWWGGGAAAPPPSQKIDEFSEILT
jgi:hypothetical protein